LGWLRGPSAEAIEHGRYKAYYMHGTSHWLGMDVHDVGEYYLDRAPRRFESGMVLTVERIYVPLESEAEERFRGIGVRIEDDIVVTETGYRNLTADIPKDLGELERRLAAREATPDA
jgi:Xaa-Pro aminopeptidase